MEAIGSSDDLDRLDSRPTAIEFLDYIPVVSLVTGVVRAIFGIIQSLVGIVALPFQLCGRASKPKTPLMLVQGVANIARGVIAMKPIIGNIALYLYDHSTAFKQDLRRAAGLELK